MEEGKYIYSIVQEEKEQSFGLIGINGREVNFLRYKDIAAAVSDIPIISINSLEKEKLMEYATVHQKVNEKIMEEYDAVPMAFGIIAPNVQEVLRILERAELQFRSALEKIANKAEFAIHIRWDEKRVLAEIADANLRIRELRHGILLKGGALSAITAKLKLGQLIHKEIEAKKKTYIECVRGVLKSLASECVLNRPIDNEMLANFSLLMEKRKETELDEKLAKLAKKYEEKLKFKCIGPMPPNSFVKINFVLGNFETVDKARRLLALGAKATLQEIKSAYYKFAQLHHPDKRQEKADEANEQMKKFTLAYSTLQNYCRCYHRPDDRPADEKYSFREEDVKKALVVH